MFNEWQWKVVAYCSEEVRRQHDDAGFVPHMLAAWAAAMNLNEAQPGDVEWTDPYKRLTPEVLTTWGQMISPELNRLGMRSPKNPINVTVGHRTCPHYREVPKLITEFCEKLRYGAFLPAEAYREFEEIHPFRDGNGRTGKVLYNFLLDSLMDPQFPPNFFGHIENP